jgi:hypothetical protein
MTMFDTFPPTRQAALDRVSALPCWVRSRTVSPTCAAGGFNHQELRQNCATPNLKLRQHQNVFYH